MKIAFIDIDGVVVDATKRFEQAAKMRAFYRQHLRTALPDALSNPANGLSVQQNFNAFLESLYWQTAFNPDLLARDTLRPSADEALDTLRGQGYTLIFMTSRPEPMREKTRDWLWNHNCIVPREGLIMKPIAAQYTKTSVWKAQTIHAFASYLDAEAVLVVDDELVNRDELARFDAPCLLRIAISLDEATKQEVPETGEI